MRITGFCPLIITKDPEAAVKVFEALGFECLHTKKGIEEGQNTNYALKDANGNRISITSTETMPQDLTGITMNVDDFQETYEFLLGKGFINPRGDKVTDTDSSKATILFAPSGFAITVSQHIKTEE